ncbi:MAG: hypothetical protein C4B59_14820 [Candidatus Methanogaster sp.]|uniref:Uncharacterized protein n=1 Tax=Candidatus Methanogaster sp. TaxID=3386292 RepID=A0AC61KZ52_9EURY|nr:MAG: hypothetical protein C4B59_14820 [ANME-2 cluster archaeon]
MFCDDKRTGYFNSPKVRSSYHKFKKLMWGAAVWNMALSLAHGLLGICTSTRGGHSDKGGLQVELRKIVTTTVLILALITISTTTAAALSCSDGDICVNQSGWWRDGGAFNTSGVPIRVAVNSATAGETIYVWNGSYTENVDIATSHLTLRGEGADVVTVTAKDQGDHVFDVTANYVNISGFTAAGATVSGNAGVRLGSRQHCIISENNCSGNHFGIWLSASSDNNMLTSNNCLDNNKDGIYLPSSSNNTLASNTANSNGDYGIRIDASSNNTLLGNNASLNGNHGIYLEDSSNSTLASNTANSNDNYGIYLYLSTNNTLAGNTVSNNSDGIYLTFSSNNTLLGNNASNNYRGICLWSSSNNNTLEENTANSNNEYGIRLDNADNNNISCNWVHNNTNAGFYLMSESTDNTIERNNIIANGNYSNVSGGWEWQFRNWQSANVSTAGNWWGTNNETRINASISDWTYDTRWGNVITNPRLDGAVPCAPIPELPTALLLVVGLLMLMGYARIRRKT